MQCAVMGRLTTLDTVAADNEDVRVDVHIEDDGMHVLVSHHGIEVVIPMHTIQDVLDKYEGYASFRHEQHNYLIPEDYLERNAECGTCGKRKAPFGRSMAHEMQSSYCNMDECDDYLKAPKPSSFFPGEFGKFNMDLYLAGPRMLALIKGILNKENVRGEDLRLVVESIEKK